MRLLLSSAVLLVVPEFMLAASLDPHIVFAPGGDATPLTTAGIAINLSAGGGGIFVFQAEVSVPPV
jgi:hypothetical protein